MKSKKIDYELQARARKYLEFVWNEEKVVNQENADEILEKLSSTIREEVLLQSNGKFLKNYPMLFKNFSEKTMRKLINFIKPVRFSPEELIVEVNKLRKIVLLWNNFFSSCSCSHYFLINTVNRKFRIRVF